MNCPFCGNADSKVIDSRESGGGVRRRRECNACDLRFTTYEQVQSRSLMIIKRDGTREEFDREKLWASLTKACAKRPLPTGLLEKALTEIETQLADNGKTEIPSKTLGEFTMSRLKDMDRVAYIRFASVYRDFQDIETFRTEIDALLKPNKEMLESNNQLSFLEDPDVVLSSPKRRRGRPSGRAMVGS